MAAVAQQVAKSQERRVPKDDANGSGGDEDKWPNGEYAGRQRKIDAGDGNRLAEQCHPEMVASVGIGEAPIMLPVEEDVFAEARHDALDPGRAGAGLDLVQKIMRRHGGHIEVVTGPTKGACLRMVFPLPGPVARE